MPDKYIPLVDLFLVAWVVVWGAVGGLGGAAFESIRAHALPSWSRLAAYAAVGSVSAMGSFAAMSVYAFIADGGAVDVLNLAGYSVAAGVGVAVSLAGVNAGVGSVLGKWHEK